MTDDFPQYHHYLAVEPDGATRPVPPTYNGIKEGLHDAGFDVVGLPDRRHEFFVDDEGMLNGARLNVAASLLAGRALYGPVVLTGVPDEEGETTRPTTFMVESLKGLADQWQLVERSAAWMGQDIGSHADADFLPSPAVISLTEEEADGYAAGDPETMQRIRDRIIRDQIGLGDDS